MRYTIDNSGIAIHVSKCGTEIRTEDRYIEYIFKGKVYKRFVKGKVLAQTDNGRGYLQVKINFQGKSIRQYVHRLVWMAYKGSIPKDLEVDHIDNNSYNCSLPNLQLLTREENMVKCHIRNPHIVENLKKMRL